MLKRPQGIFKIIFISFLVISFTVSAETSDKDLPASDLHSKLNFIYKHNQYLKSRLDAQDESLQGILSSLKSLDDKLDYRKKSGSETAFSNNNVTMADFNSKNDDLLRKCDEIVDNYYNRKSQQEKKYIQDLFNSEANDPQWERNIEDQLQNFIDNNNLNQSEFFDINCKNSVCKMRVQHQSSQASQQFRNKLRDYSNWNVYDRHNKYDPVTGGIITSITLLRDRKQIHLFVWGQ